MSPSVLPIPRLKTQNVRILVDGVHRHRDDLAGGVALATAWGAEDQDLILAGRKRHSRHQGGKVLVTTVIAGVDRGVIAGAKVEVLIGIRVGSGPNTALRATLKRGFAARTVFCVVSSSRARPPAALRQRNLIPSAAQPYTNPLGLTYDSGDYEQVMERALAHADWQGFAARRAEARRRGRWRGIGIANFVEITTGAPRERTEITVLPDGKVRHHSVRATCSSLRGFAADSLASPSLSL
jgi:hypothetical protein